MNTPGVRQCSISTGGGARQYSSAGSPRSTRGAALRRPAKLRQQRVRMLFRQQHARRQKPWQAVVADKPGAIGQRTPVVEGKLDLPAAKAKQTAKAFLDPVKARLAEGRHHQREGPLRLREPIRRAEPDVTPGMSQIESPPVLPPPLPGVDKTG